MKKDCLNIETEKIIIMKKQMIFHYEASGFASDNKAQFENLLADGWVVAQISAIDHDACWVLLEKTTD